MIRKFYCLLDKKALLILFIALIVSPTLCGKNTYTICLIYSHYLTIYLNNIYLLVVYQYTSRLNALDSLLITRIGEDKYYMNSYLILLSMGIIYNIIIYVSYYFFFGSIPPDLILLTIIFMILNIIINGIENTIIYLQIGRKKNFSYLAIPIIMNFMFHILFTKLF